MHDDLNAPSGQAAKGATNQEKNLEYNSLEVEPDVLSEDDLDDVYGGVSVHPDFDW